MLSRPGILGLVITFASAIAVLAGGFTLEIGRPSAIRKRGLNIRS